MFSTSSAQEKHYLGLDLSTQQLKATIIDDEQNVVSETCVIFDSDLPQFRTHGGANRQDSESCVVTAPVLMWIKALDLLLDRVKLTGIDFSTIKAISGCGQQHGSVYWKTGARQTLSSLHPNRFLHEQLVNSFSVRDCPIWMDSSTTKECQEIEAAVGGAHRLAELTGSRAYERFTASQIRKIATQRKDVYESTERISLVSSFLASLLLGSYAPIDLSDGSGMNLLDIKNEKWSADCLDATAPNLAEKLGASEKLSEGLVPSNAVLGNISNYYVERYSFDANCSIVAFTGDNPGSVLGMGLAPNEFVVSLGTSDTIFALVPEAHPSPELIGHIFCSPIRLKQNKKAFMGMVCFKNGSKTRERIRDFASEGDWSIFGELLDSTPRGNFGNIGQYFDMQEIHPPVVGDFRFNKMDERVSKFSKEVDVRAAIEGQFLRLRLHAEDLGLLKEGEGAMGAGILVTGGGSKNKAVLQVIADVFNGRVYTMKQANSAALGCAFMAKYALSDGSQIFNEMVASKLERELSCEPAKDSGDIYTPMVLRLRKLLHKIELLSGNNNK